jgi:cobalt-zinc-cadmium efflux system outer membrane protein
MYRREKWNYKRQLCAVAAFSVCSVINVFAQNTNQPRQIQSVKDIFDATWLRQPEAQALESRQQALQAQKRAAAALTPEPAAVELNSKSDQWNRNLGAREEQIAIAVPMWLPGERSKSSALAEAQANALEYQIKANQLRVAGKIREDWWNLHRARIEQEVTADQLTNARRLADDVAKRVKAGDLAQSDQHQAEGAAAVAESAYAMAQANLELAIQIIQSSIGATSFSMLDLSESPELPPSAEYPQVHAALMELQARSDVAERTVALATTRTRANPEFTIAKSRDRGNLVDPYSSKVTIGIRLPFGSGPRYEATVANAQAEATQAQAQLSLERDRTQSMWRIAQAKANAAQAQLKAAERRAKLALESRTFFDKSFQLGESDLPTRLRIEAEAVEARRQAALSRIEYSASISALRQAAGLLPQ